MAQKKTNRQVDGENYINVELHNLYVNTDIVTTPKSCGLWWAGYVAWRGNRRRTRKILQENYEGEWKTLVRDRVIWRAYVLATMDFRVL